MLPWFKQKRLLPLSIHGYIAVYMSHHETLEPYLLKLNIRHPQFVLG